MIWILAVVAVLLIALGAWGGPRRRVRPDKAQRIPKDSTVQEAWDILTSPVEYDEEIIKIPQARPWYVLGREQRFLRGLLVGAGCGLLIALAFSPLYARGPKAPQVAQGENPKAEQKPDAPAAEPPAQQPKAEEPKPAAEPEQPAVVKLEIPEGSVSQEIAAKLKEAKLIADEKAFLDQVTAKGAEAGLKAGTFEIPAKATIDEIIAILTK